VPLKTSLFKWLTIVFTAMLFSSFLSMMAAFVGSEGSDLRDLIVLQVVLIPVALAVTSLCAGILLRRHGRQGAGLAKIWDSLPGWLLFAVLAANSLVLIAELSFLLIQHHTGTARPWQEHVPAATAFCSSLALMACYLVFRLDDGEPHAPGGRQ
jgi:uncharacterized membrane protein